MLPSPTFSGGFYENHRKNRRYHIRRLVIILRYRICRENLMPRFVDIDATIKVVREKAILIDDGDGPTWVPRSVVANINELDLDDSEALQELKVAEWFATKEHLI